MPQTSEGKAGKMIVVTLDGSVNALKAIDYINLVFGPQKDLTVCLLYILPGLPPLLTETRLSRETADKLQKVEKESRTMAENILAEGKEKLLRFGFSESRIETAYEKKRYNTAKDICAYAERKRADAIAISTLGRSFLETFMMGETATKVLEFGKICPTWLIKRDVKGKNILMAVDGSENSLRAVERAGYLLSGTDSQIILFHAVRNLRKFLPKKLLESAPELEEIYKTSAGADIASHVGRARKTLTAFGIPDNQIFTKIVDGTRNPAKDLLECAKKEACGTIVMGRWGEAGPESGSMGTNLKKVLSSYDNMALWIVP